MKIFYGFEDDSAPMNIYDIFGEHYYWHGENETCFIRIKQFGRKTRGVIVFGLGTIFRQSKNEVKQGIVFHNWLRKIKL